MEKVMESQGISRAQKNMNPVLIIDYFYYNLL